MLVNCSGEATNSLSPPCQTPFERQENCRGIAKDEIDSTTQIEEAHQKAPRCGGSPRGAFSGRGPFQEDSGKPLCRKAFQGQWRNPVPKAAPRHGSGRPTAGPYPVQ
jgi:hypothetical protein